MSPKTDPSALDYLGSTLGSAYFSGIGFDMMFEAVCVTHDESAAHTNPQWRVEISEFKCLDSTINAAIEAKEWLDNIVLQNGNNR